jgi:hypothetical protein
MNLKNTRQKNMETTQLQFVTFKQARLLKKLGLDWSDIILIVHTVAHAFEWLRENWLLVDWLDFSGEYDEYGEPLFFTNYLFGKEPRRTSKKAMPRKSAESALLDDILNVLMNLKTEEK